MAVATGPRHGARVAARGEPFAEPKPSLIERAGVLRLDLWLLAASIGLIAFSVFTLSQATTEDFADNPYHFVIRQSIYAVVGIALMLAVARVDYSRFRELRVGLYTAMIVGICLVFVFATAIKGSKRWIDVGLFQFQPSEFGKLILILSLAAVVIDRRLTDGWAKTRRVLMLGAIPAALVFLQPDLGSALVYGVITLAVLYIGGAPWQHFAVIGALAVAAIGFVLVLAPAIGHPILQDYQRDRLTSFVDPEADLGGSGYQINQSKIAIGAGGKTGLGDGATQTQTGGFLPERETDFIFAVVGERFGFAGAAFVLSLFALLIWRALRIMTLSKNLYGSIIAGSIAAMTLFHVFVNVGMNIGIAPVTGIPLPLVSSGGSSVIVTFLALGLLQSIYVQSQHSPSRREDMPMR